MVLDKQTQSPLTGASIQILASTPPLGAITDDNGAFRIANVPIGRRSLKVRYVGYHEQTISDLVITSAKEMIVTIQLEEMLVQTEEIVISAESEKDLPNNELAIVSTRSFNIDETRRFAGNRNDPARMAANFAGVNGADDSRNDIIIRGNSPTGVLWRLDGVAIPNPNHFSGLGTTGGPVSMINNNMLTNSDFMTSAFPAEYGNATSGVFDLKMRAGNNEKHEFMGQVGFNGFEGLAEGPISKKNGSSYLAAYRYSTLEVFNALGISFGTSALPKYQDFSFKLNFPNTKLGSFSVFGLGGISNIELLDSKVGEDDLYGGNGLDIYFGSQMGTVGINHIYYFGKNTYSKFVISASREETSSNIDSADIYIPKVNRSYNPLQRERSINNRLTASAFVNHKFNARTTWKTGVIGDYFLIDYSSRLVLGGSWWNRRSFEGNTQLMQAYSQFQYRISEKITATGGLHYQYLFLNNTQGIGPRGGLTWKIAKKHQINIGYGLHYQMQTLALYMLTTQTQPNADLLKTNQNMDFTRSQHFVAGYDFRVTPSIRIKWENYYQSLDKVPVETNSSTFSSINLGADFGTPDVDSLTNKGIGYNYGTELTIEKFFSQNYYVLSTLSIYNSRYKGSDGIERNTAFNNNFVYNILAGKEFPIGKRNNVLTLDIKMTWSGGRRYTPIDTIASRLSGETKYNTDQEWALQFPNYFRADIKFGFRINRPNTSHHFFLDMQNISNRQNYFSQSYDIVKQKITTTYQLGLFPVFNYRIEF